MACNRSEKAASSSSLRSGYEYQWIDLPDDLTEKILERLPITSYVRFASVCRQWRTLQEYHRRRHSPSPPPMLNLPLFIPFHEEEQQTPSASTPLIISPFDNHRHHYSYILDSLLRKRKKPSPYHNSSSSLPCGWLILEDYPHRYNPHSFRFTVLNPISGVQFQLPKTFSDYFNYRAAMSSPRPDSWALFVIAKQRLGCDLLFFQWGDTDWTWLSHSDLKFVHFDRLTNIVFFRGMFYCVRYEYTLLFIHDLNLLGICLYVLDLDPVPEVRMVEMDGSQLPPVVENTKVSLVESDGDLLLTVEISEDEDKLEVRVFKADLSKKMWVTMESIGDTMLVLSHQCDVSLVAADLGVRGNCIYSCSDLSSWTVFDVAIGRVTNRWVTLPSPSTHLMFLPSLC